MRRNDESKDPQKLIEEIRARQRNTVWPDLLINNRGVDAFLWKGSRDAPLVQRIAAWLFGLFFLAAGVAFLDIAYERQSVIPIVMSILFFLIGGRVFFNGFRRRKSRNK